MTFLKFLIRNLDDILFILGGVAILIGTYKLSPIAAWFVGGAECLIAGVVIAWSSRNNNDPS